MKIERIPVTLDSHKYSAEWDAVRSPGLHLMQIVDRMEQERELLLGNKPRDFSEFSEADLQAYRFGGFTYEHVIAQHIIDIECDREPTRLLRPGEYFWCYHCKVSLGALEPQRDRCLGAGHTGIFGTPDAVRIDSWRLAEWKFTWKSLRRAGADNVTHTEHVRDGIWKWPVQSMAYCYLLGMTGADLDAYFVNGDYTNRRPQAVRFVMDFEQYELEENWSAIVSTALEAGWL